MNNKDNFEISQELEQMREQFNILSRKLDEQNIVTDGILRSCAREKMEKYDRRAIWTPMIAWIVLGGWLISKQATDYGMAQWSVIFSIIACVIEVGLYAYKKFQQSRTLDFNGDIKEFYAQVKSLKGSLLKTTLLSVIVGYVWIGAFLWEFFRVHPINSAKGIFLLVGYLVIMSFIHLRAEKKALGILDEIAEEIDK
ncbi:MAG: hypothetical protein IKT74_06140 [Bacteroidales bacterium]|nr:hypothetical protein [Bacteroidales bacterium]